jgi:hypothetical protein
MANGLPYEDLVQFWLQAKYEESKTFLNNLLYFWLNKYLNHVLRICFDILQLNFDQVMALENSLKKTLEF